jgi:hypothetical protein
MIGVVTQLRAAGYDISLQGDEISLNFIVGGEPDSTVVLPLIEELRVYKSDLQELLRPAKGTLNLNLSQAIDSARDWQDLSEICDQIDTAFNVGELAAEQADPLIAAVITRSRELPEVAGYKPVSE